MDREDVYARPFHITISSYTGRHSRLSCVKAIYCFSGETIGFWYSLAIIKNPTGWTQELSFIQETLSPKQFMNVEKMLAEWSLESVSVSLSLSILATEFLGNARFWGNAELPVIAGNARLFSLLHNHTCQF